MHRPVLLSVVPGTSMLRLTLTVSTYFAASLRAWLLRATGEVEAHSASRTLTCGVVAPSLYIESTHKSMILLHAVQRIC